MLRGLPRLSLDPRQAPYERDHKGCVYRFQRHSLSHLPRQASGRPAAFP